ncbi:MAG: hypothetical protein AB7T08_09105 [Hyphomonadaceae bacterium]
MIRSAFVAVLLLSVAACGQSSQAPGAPSPTPQAPVACNDVAINPAVSVAPAVGVATAPPQTALLGGPIAPGTYDLTRVEQRGGAPEWTDQRWQSVRIGESEAGQTFDFASARGAADASADRFSARLDEGPPVALVYTCGRTGTAAMSYAAVGPELQLLLPAEGGAGQTLLVFVRRAG